MKQRGVRIVLMAMLVCGMAAPLVAAEEAKEAAARALPTLLIKGEVVSVDTNDPSSALLKVKDRYGFETPIYVKPDTKITKGNQSVAVADLRPGTALEVEYNFDINTAKRHAAKVTVNVPVTSATATPPVTPAAMPAVPSAAVATPPAASVPMTPPAAAVSATMATPTPAAAPAPVEPAAPTTPAATPPAGGSSGSTTQ